MQGLSFIHRSLLGSHGRLKTSNCLISSRWILKINGFGVHSLRSATAYESENEQYSSIYDRNYFICHISLFFFSFNCFCFSCHNLLFSTHFCHHSIGIIAFNKTAKFSEILQIAPRNLATFDAKKRGPCSSSSSLLLLVLLILQYLSCIYMFVRCRTRKRETLS